MSIPHNAEHVEAAAFYGYLRSVLRTFSIKRARVLTNPVIDENGGLHLQVLLKPISPRSKLRLQFSVRLEIEQGPDDETEAWKKS